MKIKKITKEFFKGSVYNLELNSVRPTDDLFWVEGRTGIITHNCFPKDLAALTFLSKSLGVDSTILESVKIKNDLVRTNRDWESQVGRAVSEE